MFDIKLYNEINKHPLNSLGLVKRTFKRFFRVDPKPKNATILFVDMCSSSLFKLDYEEVWQENIFYLQEKAKKILKLCNGTFSKNIGDCVLCYFVGDKQADNATKFAYSMLEHFRLVVEDMTMNGWDTSIFQFHISIGIANGPVFFLYPNDPFGTPVDLAARLQSKAEFQQACFQADFFELIKDNELKEFLKRFLTGRQVVELKSFGQIEIEKMTIREYVGKKNYI